jgi:CRISPR-associated protein Csd1
MILQSLNDLYTRLAGDPAYEIAPPGFSPQKIAFCIRIRPDGSLVQIEDARKPDERGRLQNDVMLVPGDGERSGRTPPPNFLWDNQTYLLGKVPEGKTEEYAASRVQAFRQRHLDAESAISDPAFSAVCRFLEKWNPDELSNHPILEEVGTGFGVFSIQGEKRSVHESRRIQEWWNSTLIPKAEESPEIGQCLLTGEHGPIARLQPSIKGVAGTKQNVGSLVSFNAPAYESYGKSQSYNAPVSESAAFQYGTALNSLLTGPQSAKHRIRIGDTTTVFWTDKPSLVEDCLAEIFGSGSQAVDEIQDIGKRQQIKRLLEAVRSGGRYQDLGESVDTPFHILGLAPNAARVSIRFYHRSTIANLLDKLHDHQRCIEIVREFAEPVGKRQADSEFPAIWQILRETARVADEIPPLLGGALARSIIEGMPYPEGLFSAIIRRIRADRTINYLRAAILKAVLIRNHQQTIPIMLDPSKTDSAYRHGRLFAVIEKIQEEGHYAQTQRKLEHTIKEKYFSSACATPAAVFPRLETLSVHHQRHLNPGRRVQFEKLIADIKWELVGTKKTHSLIEQGQFILGYYHQRKDLFVSNSDRENQPDEFTATA